jgi:predicted MPP superfamily phosphohydrolase
MEDFQRKRQLIEQGQLTSWQCRARHSWSFTSLYFLRPALRVGLRLTGLYTRGERNARNAVLRPLRFAFDALPPAFHGFTILHLSDLHVDGLPDLAEDIYARIQHLEVDLCVLTGDYRFKSYGPCEDVYLSLEKLVPHIRARYGIVGILGNHDVSEKVPHLERMGIRMLINEAFELRHRGESIWLVGLDDPHYYGCDDLPGALRGVPEEAFKMLLVHTPELVAEAAEYGVQLYLCGHTHGGQICLPGVGPVFTGTSCPRKYLHGIWQHRSMHGYTSAGVGASIVPVRFRCPPEIGLIELCDARQAGEGTPGRAHSMSEEVR